MAVYESRDRIYLAALGRREQLYQLVEQALRGHLLAHGEDPHAPLRILQLDRALCPREGGEHRIREAFDFDAAAAHRALSVMELPAQVATGGGRQVLAIHHPGGVGDVLRVADGGSWAGGTLLQSLPEDLPETSELAFVALA